MPAVYPIQGPYLPPPEAQVSDEQRRAAERRETREREAQRRETHRQLPRYAITVALSPSSALIFPGPRPGPRPELHS